MTDSNLSYCRGDTKAPMVYETIGNYLEHIVQQYPDEPALIVAHQNIRWNYRQYLQAIDRLATGLLKLGVKPGERVGIWSPNNVEWCLTQFATARIGAVLVCINPAYRVFELEYALNKVGCRVIVTAAKFKNSDYIEQLQTLAPELNACPASELRAQKLPDLEIVIRLGQEKTPGMLNFDDVCQLGGNREFQQLDALKTTLQPDDAINIQFTSGTTGNPKGATLTHHNILNNGLHVGRGMKFTHKDRLCIPVPLYHCFGMVMGNLTCMTHGAAAVFPGEGFDPLATLKVVEAEQCTALHGVPTMFIAELELPEFKQFDLSSLRTGIMAGAPCPIEVMKRVIADMHMGEVIIAYGQTECSPVNHMTSADDPLEKRIGSVGRVAPWQEIKIVDDNGRVVGIGEKGELCCRGYAVMSGYWADEEQTRQTIDQAHWLHSGDLATMDADGYLEIVGRIKDLIIRGGENIYPREIEEFLYTHDAIQEVQVFGVEDRKFGEEICAWIQLKEGASITEEEIKQHCRNNIAHFKVPRYISFVTSYPLTVTGKIQKFKMREEMQKQLKDMEKG